MDWRAIGTRVLSCAAVGFFLGPAALSPWAARAADTVLVGSVDPSSANLWPLYIGQKLGYKLYECYRDGGVPPGAFHLIIGRGAVAGDHLWHHPEVNGITFTGSYPCVLACRTERSSSAMLDAPFHCRSVSGK